MTTDPRSITAMIEQLSKTVDRMEGYYLLDPHYKELQALISCCPYPMWFKDTDLRMVYLNKAYELEFGISVVQYASRLDHEIWPKFVADEYAHNDRLVVSTQQPISVVERYVSKIGEEFEISVVKWPLFVQDTILGVAGMALGRSI